MAQLTTTKMAEESSLPLPPRQKATRTRMRTRTTLREQKNAYEQSIRKTDRAKTQGIRVFSIPTVGLIIAVLAVIATSASGLSVRIPGQDNALQTNTNTELLMTDIAIERHIEDEAAPWEPLAKVHLSSENGGSFLLRCRDHIIPTTNISTFAALATWNRNISFAGKVDNINAALHCLFYRSANDFSGNETVHIAVELVDAQHTAHVPIRVAPADELSRPHLNLAIARLSAGITEDPSDAFPLGERLSSRIVDPLQASLGIEISSVANAVLQTPGYARTGLTAAQAQAALDALTYLPSVNFFGQDVVSIRVVNEDTNASDAKHLIVDVRAENDAPTLSLGDAIRNMTLRAGVATPLRTLPDNQAGVVIEDVDTTPGERFRCGIRAPPGVLQIARHAGVHVSTTANVMGTSDVETILQGTLPALHAALRNIVLAPSSDAELTMWFWAMDASELRSEIHKLTLQVQTAPLQALFERPEQAPITFDISQGTSFNLSALEVVLSDNSDSVHAERDITTVISLALTIDPAAGFIDVISGEQLPYWVARQGLGTAQIHLQGSPAEVTTALTRLELKMDDAWESSTQMKAVTLTLRASATSEDLASSSSSLSSSSSSSSVLIVQLFVIPRQTLPVLEFAEPSGQDRTARLDGPPVSLPFRALFSTYASSPTAEAYIRTLSQNSICGSSQLAIEPKGLHVESLGNDLILRGEAERVSKALLHLVFAPSSSKECSNEILPQQIAVVVHLVQQPFESSRVTIPVLVNSADFALGFVLGSTSPLKVRTDDESGEQSALRFTPDVLRLENLVQQAETPLIGSQAYTLWVQARIGSFTLAEQVHKDVTAIFSDQGRSLVLKSVDLSKLRTTLSQVVYTPFPATQGLEVILVELHVVQSGRTTSSRACEAIINIEVGRGDTTFEIEWTPSNPQELSLLTRESPEAPKVYEASLQGIDFRTSKSHAEPLLVEISPASESILTANFHIDPDAQLGLSLLFPSIVHGPLDEILLAVRHGLLRTRMTVAAKSTAAQSQLLGILLTVGDLSGSERSLRNASIEEVKSLIENNRLAEPYSLIFTSQDAPQSNALLQEVELLVGGSAYPFPNLLANPVLANDEHVAQGLELPSFKVQSWSASEVLSLQLQTAHGLLRVGGDRSAQEVESFETVASLNAWLAQGLRYFPARGMAGLDHVSCAIYGKDRLLLYSTQIVIFVGDGPRGLSPEESPLADSATLEVARDTLVVHAAMNDAQPIIFDLQTHIAQGTPRALYELEVRPTAGMVTFAETQGLAMSAGGAILQGQRDKLNAALASATFAPVHGLDEMVCNLEILLRRPANPTFVVSRMIHLSIQRQTQIARGSQLHASNAGGATALGVLRRNPDQDSTMLRVEEGQRFKISGLGWTYTFEQDIAQLPIIVHVSTSQGRLLLRNPLDALQYQILSQIDDAIIVRQVAQDIPHLLDQLEVQLPEHWNSMFAGDACFVEIALLQSIDALDEVTPLIVPVHVQPPLQRPSITGMLALEAGAAGLSLSPLFFEGWTGFASAKAVDLELGSVAGGQILVPDGLGLANLQSANAVHEAFVQITATLEPASGELRFRVKIYEHATNDILCERSFWIARQERVRSAQIASEVQVFHANQDQSLRLGSLAVNFVNFDQEACELLAIAHHGTLTLVPSQAATSQLRCSHNGTAQVHCLGTPESLASVVASGLHYRSKASFNGIDTLALHIKLKSADPEDYLTEMSLPVIVHATASQIELSIAAISASTILSALEIGASNSLDFSPAISVPILLQGLDARSHDAHIRLRSDGGLRGSWQITHPAFQTLQVKTDGDDRVLELRGALRKLQKALEHHIQFTLMTPLDTRTTAKSTELIVEAWIDSDDEALQEASAPHAADRRVLQLPLTSENGQLQLPQSGCFVQFESGCQTLRFLRRAPLSRTGLRLGWHENWFSPPTRTSAVISVAASGAVRLTVPEDAAIDANVTWSLSSTGQKLDIIAASLENAERWLHNVFVEDEPSERHGPRASLSVQARLQTEHPGLSSSATCMLPSLRASNEVDVSISVETDVLIMSAAQTQVVVPRITVERSPSSAVAHGRMPVEARVSSTEGQALRISVHPSVTVRLGIFANQSDPQEIYIRASSESVLNDALANLVLSRSGDSPWDGDATLTLQIDDQFFENVVHVHVEAPNPTFWEVSGSYRRGILHGPTVARNARMSMSWQHGEPLSFDGLRIGSAMSSDTAGLRSIRVEATNGHGLWLDDALSQLTTSVITNPADLQRTTLIILEPQGSADTGLRESQLLETVCDAKPEIHSISVADSATSDPISGSFRVSWRGITSNDIAHNASSSEIQAELEAIVDVGALTVTREMNSNSSASEAYTWFITFSEPSSGPTGDVFGIEDAMFSSASTAVISQLERAGNVIGGAFRLGYFGRWTSLLSWNVDPSELEHSLIGLAPTLLESGVHVTLESEGSWGTRSYRVTFEIMGQFPLIEPDTTMLTGDGASMTVTRDTAGVNASWAIFRFHHQGLSSRLVSSRSALTHVSRALQDVGLVLEPQVSENLWVGPHPNGDSGDGFLWVISATIASGLRVEAVETTGTLWVSSTARAMTLQARSDTSMDDILSALRLYPNVARVPGRSQLSFTVLKAVNTLLQSETDSLRIDFLSSSTTGDQAASSAAQCTLNVAASTVAVDGFTRTHGQLFQAAVPRIECSGPVQQLELRMVAYQGLLSLSAKAPVVAVKGARGLVQEKMWSTDETAGIGVSEIIVRGSQDAIQEAMNSAAYVFGSWKELHLDQAQAQITSLRISRHLRHPTPSVFVVETRCNVGVISGSFVLAIEIAQLDSEGRVTTHTTDLTASIDVQASFEDMENRLLAVSTWPEGEAIQVKRSSETNAQLTYTWEVTVVHSIASQGHVLSIAVDSSSLSSSSVQASTSVAAETITSAFSADLSSVTISCLNGDAVFTADASAEEVQAAFASPIIVSRGSDGSLLLGSSLIGGALPPMNCESNDPHVWIWESIAQASEPTFTDAVVLEIRNPLTNETRASNTISVRGEATVDQVLRNTMHLARPSKVLHCIAGDEAVQVSGFFLAIATLEQSPSLSLPLQCAVRAERGTAYFRLPEGNTQDVVFDRDLESLQNLIHSGIRYTPPTAGSASDSIQLSCHIEWGGMMRSSIVESDAAILSSSAEIIVHDERRTSARISGPESISLQRGELWGFDGRLQLETDEENSNVSVDVRLTTQIGTFVGLSSDSDSRIAQDVHTETYADESSVRIVGLSSDVAAVLSSMSFFASAESDESANVIEIMVDGRVQAQIAITVASQYLPLLVAECSQANGCLVEIEEDSTVLIAELAGVHISPVALSQCSSESVSFQVTSDSGRLFTGHVSPDLAFRGGLDPLEWSTRAKLDALEDALARLLYSSSHKWYGHDIVSIDYTCGDFRTRIEIHVHVLPVDDHLTIEAATSGPLYAALDVPLLVHHYRIVDPDELAGSSQDCVPLILTLMTQTGHLHVEELFGAALEKGNVFLPGYDVNRVLAFRACASKLNLLLQSIQYTRMRKQKANTAIADTLSIHVRRAHEAEEAHVSAHTQIELERQPGDDLPALVRKTNADQDDDRVDAPVPLHLNKQVRLSDLISLEGGDFSNASPGSSALLTITTQYGSIRSETLLDELETAHVVFRADQRLVIQVESDSINLQNVLSLVWYASLPPADALRWHAQLLSTDQKNDVISVDLVATSYAHDLEKTSELLPHVDVPLLISIPEELILPEIELFQNITSHALRLRDARPIWLSDQADEDTQDVVIADAELVMLEISIAPVGQLELVRDACLFVHCQVEEEGQKVHISGRLRHVLNAVGHDRDALRARAPVQRSGNEVVTVEATLSRQGFSTQRRSSLQILLSESSASCILRDIMLEAHAPLTRAQVVGPVPLDFFLRDRVAGRASTAAISLTVQIVAGSGVLEPPSRNDPSIDVQRLATDWFIVRGLVEDVDRVLQETQVLSNRPHEFGADRAFAFAEVYVSVVAKACGTTKLEARKVFVFPEEKNKVTSVFEAHIFSSQGKEHLEAKASMMMTDMVDVRVASGATDTEDLELVISCGSGRFSIEGLCSAAVNIQGLRSNRILLSLPAGHPIQLAHCVSKIKYTAGTDSDTISAYVNGKDESLFAISVEIVTVEPVWAFSALGVENNAAALTSASLSSGLIDLSAAFGHFALTRDRGEPTSALMSVTFAAARDSARLLWKNQSEIHGVMATETMDGGVLIQGSQPQVIQALATHAPLFYEPPQSSWCGRDHIRIHVNGVSVRALKLEILCEGPESTPTWSDQVSLAIQGFEDRKLDFGVASGLQVVDTASQLHGCNNEAWLVHVQLSTINGLSTQFTMPKSVPGVRAELGESADFVGCASDVNAALRALVIAPEADTFGNASLQCSVSRLASTDEDRVELRIEFEAVHDGPRIRHIPANHTLQVMEGETLVLGGFYIHDADVTSSSQDAYEVTLRVPTGTIYAGSPAEERNIRITRSDSGDVILRGLLSELNLELKRVLYTAPSRFTGTLNLEASVQDKHEHRSVSTISVTVAGVGTGISLRRLQADVLTFAPTLVPSSSVSLAGVVALEDDLRAPEFAQLTVTADPAGAQPEVQQIVVRRPVFSDVHLVRLAATQNEAAAPATFKLSYDGETTGDIDRAALDSASKELGSSLGASLESMLAALGTVGQVEVSRTKLGAYGLEWAVTFFRTSPGPALVLESEIDPSDAIDVTISRTGGVDELELEGDFTLQLGSRVSTSLSFDTPAVFIQRALEALPTVHLVHVDEQALLASEDAEVFNAWTVTFVRPAGDIPLLKALVLNSTVPEVRVEISEITKGQGVAAVQRVITSARHQNMVLALRSTAVMGPVEGSFRLALDLRSLGGSRVVSNVVDHAAVATIAEERVHSARGSRPGDSIESVVNAMLQTASQGLEAHFESFDSTAMYVSVSRSDQICEHDCNVFSEEYPAGPLCTFDSACDVCVGLCSEAQDKRCFQDSHCLGSCLLPATGKTGECLSSGNPCATNDDCLSSGVCDASNCVANADGAFTWFIEFHNAPSALPLLEIEEHHLVAVDTPDLYIGLLQARKASPVPEVAANQVSGSLALDGITFTHAADTDITLPQILSFASGPDLEAGLVLYLIDLGRAASGLPFPVGVNGSLLEGQGVHVDSALKFPTSRVKSEPELQLDVETTGVSWVEHMARNKIRFQGTVPELNDVLQQSVKGLRLSGHRGWYGRALINFEATALTSDDEVGLHESVFVDVAPRTPEVRLQLASSVRSLREDLDVFVFGSKPGQIEAIVFGDEDIPLRLSVQVSAGFVWILPEYRLLHRSIAEANERPAWSQLESSLVFKGTLTEVRSALAHLQYRSATLGVAELKLDISADLTQGLGHNSSLAEVPAISRTVFLNVRPLDQPLLFVNGTLHRDISVSESESVSLLSEVRLVSEEPFREMVEATLEVQRGKLTLALRDEWDGQDEVAVSEDGKMLRVRSTREGLNQQIFPYVLYRAARTHYTGEDMGILTVTSAATQRLASLTVQISITETDDPLQIVSQSPTEPLRILEDQPLPLEGIFHVTDVDRVPLGELRDENITLELRTLARHVDMQQAIRTTADGGVLIGHFKVSIDLTPWGGTVAESERIAANAVPSITSERTTHATGTGRGESVEAKINALLAQAQNGSILTEPITVSVSQTDEVCSYECKTVLAAYDSSSLLCSKSAHCDLCVGHCQGGTVHRCSSDADCDGGTGSCLFRRGECLSDGTPCSSHVSCQESGECIASGCAANTVGGNIWTITFSKAPWDLPMLFISEENFFGATNARVACDVIINRTPARPVQESNRLGGSFRINDKVLSYNASAKEVQSVFEELADLALVRNATLHGPHAAPVPVGGSFVEIVEREGPSLEDGYVWTIRMTAAAQAFASSLIVDSALLEGLEPEASLHFVGENVSRITGAHVHIESKHGVVGVRGTGRQNAVENYSVQLADSSLLEEYLESLVFLPDQNWNSEAGRDFGSVRVEVLKDNDLEGRARVATQLVHVAAVNDGPVLHVPGQVLDENHLTADQVSGRLLSVNDYSVREGSTERIAGLSIRDVDAGTKAIHIELLATNGTLSLAAEVALQDFQQMNASSMSWTGSVSAVNHAFQQLLFTSENMFGNGGHASVHIIATDGGHSGDDGRIGSDSVTVPLLVVANDDAPELELPVNRHAWYCREDDSLALPGLLIRYDNYPEHESVQLEAYASHGVVQVPVVFANVSMSSLPDQGLFLEGTVAAVNGALAEAIYTPNADYSSTQTQQPDEITFTLRSVRGDIVYNSASVYVEAVNDEPFLSVPGATVEYDGAGRYVTTATPTLTTAEDHPLMIPTMTVIDADGDFEVIHLTFSCQYGSLRLAHTAAELSIEVSAESSTLWVSGQLGRVNKALGEAQDAGVVYTPTRDWSGIDVVIISVQDAAGSTDMVTLTIVVEAVNDAPVWQLPDPATLRVDEDGALALSTVRVLDVDVDAADPFLVRIEPVHGMVSVLNEAKSRSVVLNSTLSLVNQALSSLLFYPASHAHALDDEAEAEAIHFIADDLGSVGSGGPRTKESVLPIVNIIPWTDPPRIEVPGAVYANETTCQESTRRSWPRRVEDVSLFDICGAIIDVAPIEALEDGDVRITGIRVQDSDLDVALTSRRLRVELTVSNGRLHVSPRGAANFVTGSDGRLVEFFGSPNECNLILDSIVYRPDLHWYGLDYLRIVAEDSTEMDSGVMGVASLRDEQMIPLHILPVQDVPQFTGELTQAYSGPAMLTTSEDQPLFLAGPHRELSLVHADGDKVEVAFIGIARHGTMSLDPDDFVEVKYLENLTQGVGAAAKGQVEVLAFTASVSTVREAIRHIIYVPEENWSGVEDITMISANLEDLSTDQVRLGDDFLGILSLRVAEATGSRGIDVEDDRYSSVVIHITVRATNDAPSVGLRSDAHSGHWVCEEDAQVNLDGIIVDDVDGDAVQVTLRAEHGKPDISDLDVTSRKLFVAVDRDDSSLTLYGPVGDVNVLFEEDLISYSPPLNWFGLDTIDVVIEDQDGASASMAGSVLVSAVNDAPEIRSMTRTGANSVFTVAEGGRLHLSGPSRLLNADAESEIVEERLEQPVAGIWRSLVVRPGRVTDDEPSWRYSLASNASEPESLTALDADTFIFSAEDGTHGRELWRSDGRADADFASTMLIKDIRPGAQSANIDNLHLHDDGLVYFAADGKDWTWMLETDTCGGFFEAVPGIWLAVSKETTFDRFGSYDCPSGYHWASTAELAAVVGPATARAEARSGQMHSYYASLCGWSFDQWEGATRHRFMLADSYETSVFLDARQEAGSPGQLAPEVLAGGVLDETVFAGTICMADAADGTPCSRSLGCFKDAGRELWATDGTAEGTKRVVDVLPGGDGSHPSDLVSFDGDIFFAAWTELYGRELWRSDGTPQGTRMVQDLWAGTGSSDPQLLTVVGSTLFFTAEDEWHGIELWVSDGDPAFTGARPSVVRTGSAGTGTYMVLDIRTGDQVGSEPTDLIHLVDNFVAFAAGDGVHGRQIWVSDGSELGTGYITDIRSDRSELGCDPQDLVVYNQQLYFTAVDGAHGRELWRVGGTDESFTATRPDGTTFAVGSGSSPLGATMVADLLPGSQGSMPTHLHVFSPSGALDPALRGVDLLVFNAMDALWVLNSASSSAVPQRAFETTAADLRFTDTGFVNLRGALFFGARPPYDTLYQRTGARQVSRKQPFFLVDVDAGSDELFSLKIETELGRIVFQDGTEAAAGVSGTLEELNVLLQSVYFEAIDGTNGAGFIIATLVDSSGASTVESFDVLVTPVNSVPVLTLSRTSVRVSRSGPKVVPLHIDVTVSDEIEVPTAILEVAIASDIGKLRIEPLDNVAIVSKGERDYVLEAEKDALSSVLSTLRLELDASIEAARYGTITLILRDHGDRGEGGPLETTAQIEIEVVD